MCVQTGRRCKSNFPFWFWYQNILKINETYSAKTVFLWALRFCSLLALFCFKKNRRSEQNLLRKNFASTKTIGGDYTTTAVELRNGRGPSWNDFLYFLRPSPAISGPGPLRPETPEKSPEWGRRGPERAGENTEENLRFSSFCLLFCSLSVFLSSLNPKTLKSKILNPKSIPNPKS